MRDPAPETVELARDAIAGFSPSNGSAPQTACEILCEWAWTKVNLENLQRAHQGKPPGEGAAGIADAIHAFQHALRKKKKLDAEYRDHHEALALAEAAAPNAKLKDAGKEASD